MSRKKSYPVESVELTISIRADRKTAEKIKALIPSAKVRGGSCELKVVGERPADMAQKAEEMMESLREVVGSPKDFKSAKGSPKKN